MPYTRPRSTMLIGISGSWTSFSASRRPSAMGMRLAEGVELLLEHGHHLGVARATCAPPREHVVPGAGIVEVPPPRLGVEGAGEGVVEHVLLALLVSGDLDAV